MEDSNVESSLPEGLSQPPVQAPEPGADPQSSFLDMVKQSNESRHTELGGNVDAIQTRQSSEPDSGDSQESLGEPQATSTPDVQNTEEPSKEATQEDGKVDDGESLLPDYQDEPAPPVKKTKAENMKNLRNIIKTEKEKSAELERERDALRAKVENVLQAEEVQNVIKEKDSRIKELEKYEDLLGLYKTDGFKEAYYDSIDNLTGEAKQVATEYGLEEAVVDQALTISNRKELNEYLSQYLDPIGVGDIRKYILDAQAVAVERHKAEQNPKQARSELVEIMKRTRETRAAEVREKLKTRMKTSWDSMLSIYSDEDSGIDILKDVSGDAQHAEIKENVLKRAETDFGKAVGVLVAAGVQDIPAEVVKAFAARFQLSEVAGYLANSNKQLKAEVDSLSKELKKVNGYTRPLSKSSGTGKTSHKAPEIATDQIASHTMAAAMAKLSQ